MHSAISGSLIPSGFLADHLAAQFESQVSAAKQSLPVSGFARWWRRAGRQLGPASSVRRVLDIGVLPLLDLLGYELLHLEPASEGFVGVLGLERKPIAVVLVLPWDFAADRTFRTAARIARTAGTRWCLAATGARLQVIDSSRPWSRRALEFDFERLIGDEHALTILWTLARASALVDVLESVIARADAHTVAVCGSLSDGVLTSLSTLVTALTRSGARREHDLEVTFEQALTLIYRLLFLLFAEARALVPTWHRVYRSAYTIDALCTRSTRQGRPSGLWQTVQAISRLAHAGCRARDLCVTPFNGRLFSPSHTPLGERARIPDTVIRDVVLSLATAPSGIGRRRIAYADLGVEQLGAVYERVLEHEPRSHNGPLILTRTSTERKATGSFYTPRSITEFLVRRTLHPLVAGRSSDEILSLRVVDPAMGSGAFIVAACRFLATAAEHARIESGEWRVGEVSVEERADLRRAIAQRCLYGVDLNPTAVQLARLSLWLTTLTTDRPLTFLDHHLVSGDSLIGASFTDLARQPSAGASAPSPAGQVLPLFEDAASFEMAADVLPDRFRIAEEPGDTLAAVRAKERALHCLNAPGAPLQRWKAAADLWCAGWFWPKRGLTPAMYGELLAAILQRCSTLPDRQAQTFLDRVSTLARRLRTFHWHLEFPEVFFDREGRLRHDGGFDAVLGNPPWDVLRADTGSESFRAEVRRQQKDGLRFFRSSGVYACQGGGHPNRYQLFAERALQLLRPGGRFGVILPSGFASDHGSAPLRRMLLGSTTIDRLFGFSNRDGIFPIHRDMRFVLVTGTRGGVTAHLRCRFGIRDATWLDRLPDLAAEDPVEARSIVLSRTLLETWDPSHVAIPELGSAKDLDILAQVTATIPALGSERGWQVHFGRELNATDDRAHFELRRATSRESLPVIEGKHLEPFRVHAERSARAVPARTASRLLNASTTFGRPRIAYRDVASATNRLTLIAAILPANTVSTHTVFCLKTALGTASQYCLLALLNSLAANYLVRLQVTTHVTASLMSRLPVPRPDGHSPDFHELAQLARELERSGVESNPESYAHLNAIAARLYGLRADQYAHILTTFPLIPLENRQRCVAAYRKVMEAGG
jgi:N-6 DNA Methylase/Eco57I restriction-modification methylase